MSDIITAVKGQASQLAGSDVSSFTLYDLVKKSDILVKHELKNSLVTLETKFNCDPSIMLHGDINNLIQVLVNIISNASQSYNGRPNQKIELVVDSDDKNAYIYIIDTGCGMSQETQDKLFKEMVTTKGKNGTGIGLYMSYSTIKGNFGGDIEFESKENVGTTFKITLPLN
jgi:C4-dicarboxylate-specific signal transduction histidine kinase